MRRVGAVARRLYIYAIDRNVRSPVQSCSQRLSSLIGSPLSSNSTSKIHHPHPVILAASRGKAAGPPAGVGVDRTFHPPGIGRNTSL